MAGKKVFVCFASEDNSRAAQVLAALDAWEVAYNALDHLPPIDGQLAPATAQAIRSCDIFLRICTPMTNRSATAALATDYFRQTLAEGRRTRRRGPHPLPHSHSHRALINLILDPGYVNDPRDADRLYITTQEKERARWLEELAVPLGVATLAQRVSRRALLGMGAGAALALAAGSAAGVLFARDQQLQAAIAAPPPITHTSGQPRWTFTLGPPADLSTLINPDIPVLAADGSRVYALNDTGVFALSLADGSQRKLSVGEGLVTQNSLTANSDPKAVTPLLAAAQGLLFLHARPATVTSQVLTSLRALRAADGALQWQIGFLDSGVPVLANGTVYMFAAHASTDGTSNDGNANSTFNHTVSAYRLRDGGLVWQQAVSQNFQSYYPNGFATLAVDRSHVYAGSSDHSVHCFDAHSGAPVWQYPASGEVHAVAVSGDLVYAACEDGALYALDTRKGTPRWRYTAGDAGLAVPPAIGDGVVYAGSRSGYLYALDAQTGALYWRAFAGDDEQTQLDHTILAQPVLARGVVFAASATNLYAFNVSDGKRRWSFTPPVSSDNFIIPGSGYPQPYVLGGLVLFADIGKRIYALNP